MSSLVCSFMAPNLPPILPEKRALWGVLEAVEEAGDGLLRITVSGREKLVDEALGPSLAELVGRRVSIVRAKGQWAVGEMRRAGA